METLPRLSALTAGGTRARGSRTRPAGSTCPCTRLDSRWHDLCAGADHCLLARGSRTPLPLCPCPPFALAQRNSVPWQLEQPFAHIHQHTLWIKATRHHPLQPLVHDAKCFLAQAEGGGLVAVVMPPDRLKMVQSEYRELGAVDREFIPHVLGEFAATDAVHQRWFPTRPLLTAFHPVIRGDQQGRSRHPVCAAAPTKRCGNFLCEAENQGGSLLSPVHDACLSWIVRQGCYRKTWGNWWLADAQRNYLIICLLVAGRLRSSVDGQSVWNLVDVRKEGPDEASSAELVRTDPLLPTRRERLNGVIGIPKLHSALPALARSTPRRRSEAPPPLPALSARRPGSPSTAPPE